MAAAVQNCARWLAAVMLLGVALCCAQTQIYDGTVSGAVAGRLTDVHSRPLGGIALVLRNTLTGAESRTTTQKNGAYRFAGLAAGEYTLEAESPELGWGRVEGIEIASGHEARVQAAVEFAPLPVDRPRAVVAETVRTQMSVPVVTREMPAMSAAPVGAEIAGASAQSLPAAVHSMAAVQPEVMTAKAEEPVVLHALPDVSEIGELDLLAFPALEPADAAVGPEMDAAVAGSRAAIAALVAKLAVLRAALTAAPPVLDATPVSTATTTLSGDAVRVLPVAGRNWQEFTLSAPPADAQTAGAEGSAFGEDARPAGGTTVDGAHLRLAFGAPGAGRAESLMSPAANDATVREVQVANGGTAAGAMDDRTRVQTRGGGTELHAEAHVYELQNLWGARDPYSQWVKETAPATEISVPVFTAFPYTPSSHDTTWGTSLGGPLRRYRMNWFGAVSGNVRSDPAVSTVKHPDDFFAQPTNDEMQVLAARLGLASANPVAEGLAAYVPMLESLAGLLGPAPRAATQLTGFGRIDWNVAERHRITIEGSGARLNAPGGGLTSTSEMYGSHSFGGLHTSDEWLLARWEAYLTPNLLAVTQGSAGRQILARPADVPSAFEQAFNINVWGQLPEMVVDSRYGFTIGNPARFGAGSYPDEHLYEAQEGLDWVHGKLMVKAGGDLRHNADAISLLRNHTGTYHYTYLTNFISDALVFEKYGMGDVLDPMNQHNCDQRGKAWRDSSGQLHGLGYLPCYSWYSQMLGPTDWQLSTNDFAGFATAQWQPVKTLVLSAAMRWERQQLPQPIALVNNPDLLLTQRMASPGNEWGPRVGLAWGVHEGRWPVLQVGYGMYFGRVGNNVIQQALAQTGSLNGDLNFMMKPTDNLNNGGAPPFPYVLAGEPGTVIKPGAVEFAPRFMNPEIHQAEAGIEERLPGRVELRVSGLMSLARRLPVTMDTNIDPAMNPQTVTYAVVDPIGAGPIKTPTITVPFYAAWPSATGANGRLNPSYQQITQIMSRANSTYEAGTVRLMRTARRGMTFQLRYTYAHAMDWNPDEGSNVTGPSVMDPNDFALEYGTSNLDQRHTVAGMVILDAPWKLRGTAGQIANGWSLATIGHYASGLPFTMRTAGSIPMIYPLDGSVIAGLAPGMNGYGGDNRVYGVGRNTYRYPDTWKADVRLGRRIALPHARELELMAESFNLFNHQNVTEVETVGYTIEPGSTSGSPPTLNFMTGLKVNTTEFGMPLNVNATDFYRPREIDFGLRLRFKYDPSLMY